MVLTTAPVLLGRAPLVPPRWTVTALHLDGVRSWPSGLVARTYRRAGTPGYAERRRRVVTPSASSPTMNTQMIATSKPMVGSGIIATSLTASTA